MILVFLKNSWKKGASNENSSDDVTVEDKANLYATLGCVIFLSIVFWSVVIKSIIEFL